MAFNLPGFLRAKLPGEKASSAIRFVLLLPVMLVFGIWAYASIKLLNTRSPDTVFNLPDIPENLCYLLGAIIFGKVLQKGIEKWQEQGSSTVKTSTESETRIAPPVPPVTTTTTETVQQ